MIQSKGRVLIPTFTAVLGGVWVFVGLRYHGWWLDGRPQSGFFPVIVGAVMAIVSVLAIISEAKGEPPHFVVAHLHPLLAAVGAIAAALLIGFFPAMTLYVFVWMKWYEKYSIKASLITTVATIGAMYGIFAMWLRVPFPVGWIVERIMG